jgi:hypothetical protein
MHSSRSSPGLTHAPSEARNWLHSPGRSARSFMCQPSRPRPPSFVSRGPYHPPSARAGTYSAQRKHPARQPSLAIVRASDTGSGLAVAKRPDLACTDGIPSGVQPRPRLSRAAASPYLPDAGVCFSLVSPPPPRPLLSLPSPRCRPSSRARRRRQTRFRPRSASAVHARLPNSLAYWAARPRCSTSSWPARPTQTRTTPRPLYSPTSMPQRLSRRVRAPQ